MNAQSDTSPVELITPEEFMSRLGIKTTTFYKWRRRGILVRGKHYFQTGAVIRIFWSAELLKELDTPKQTNRNPPADANAVAAIAQKLPRKGSAINLTY